MGHMSKKSWIFLALTFLPFLMGIGASLLAQGIWNPVPILVFKMDVGVVMFLAGLGITLFLLAIWIGASSNAAQTKRLIENSSREAEQGRKRFIRRLDHEMKNPLKIGRAHV